MDITKDAMDLRWVAPSNGTVRVVTCYDSVAVGEPLRVHVGQPVSLVLLVGKKYWSPSCEVVLDTVNRTGLIAGPGQGLVFLPD